MGIRGNHQDQDALVQITCPRCGMPVAATQERCPRCAAPLVPLGFTCMADGAAAGTHGTCGAAVGGCASCSLAKAHLRPRLSLKLTRDQRPHVR